MSSHMWAPGTRRSRLAHAPGKRDPDELAATLVWLSSDAGAYVTGQTITVDGGVTISWRKGEFDHRDEAAG
jgi:NAD(P)-dependent dehydrogenase (short-subunit alcohol dehydrogenase family)